MRALFLCVGITGACLGIITTFVLAGDRTVLVPPPESVAETFYRQLATGRYDRALPHLSDNVRRNVTVDYLRAWTIAFETRHGAIDDVRGEAGERERDRAEAVAQLKTAAGWHSTPVRLTFANGAWKIASPP